MQSELKVFKWLVGFNSLEKPQYLYYVNSNGGRKFPRGTSPECKIYLSSV